MTSSSCHECHEWHDVSCTSWEDINFKTWVNMSCHVVFLMSCTHVLSPYADTYPCEEATMTSSTRVIYIVYRKIESIGGLTAGITKSSMRAYHCRWKEKCTVVVFGGLAKKTSRTFNFKKQGKTGKRDNRYCILDTIRKRIELGRPCNA